MYVTLKLSIIFFIGLHALLHKINVFFRLKIPFFIYCYITEDVYSQNQKYIVYHIVYFVYLSIQYIEINCINDLHM